MVLKVTRLRRRGFTSRWAPLLEPLLEPLPAPFPEPLPLDDASCGWPLEFPFGLPIFEKQARIDAGGRPASADWGYRPRSATVMEERSKSLPTMWTDQSLVPCPAAGAEFSATTPLRGTALESFSLRPFPLLDPLPAFPFPLLPGKPPHRAMAI